MVRAPTRSGPAVGFAGRRAVAKGMTLMEVMVSVAILAGMILAFNIILSQSQRVVSGTQRSIRANSAGMAIAQVIRRDVASITKNGFLYIGNNTMAFTTAGVSESVTGTAQADASLICYQLVGSTFCRRGLLLTRSPGTSEDVWAKDLAEIQSMDPGGIPGLVSSIPTAFQDRIPVVPPTNGTQVRNLWQVLTHNVAGLTINSIGGGAGPWTYRNQDLWPHAVRIKFTVNTQSEIRRALRDIDNPDNAVAYEVICPIGR